MIHHLILIPPLQRLSHTTHLTTHHIHLTPPRTKYPRKSSQLFLRSSKNVKACSPKSKLTHQMKKNSKYAMLPLPPSHIIQSPHQSTLSTFSLTRSAASFPSFDLVELRYAQTSLTSSNILTAFSSLPNAIPWLLAEISSHASIV